MAIVGGRLKVYQKVESRPRRGHVLRRSYSLVTPCNHAVLGEIQKHESCRRHGVRSRRDFKSTQHWTSKRFAAWWYIKAYMCLEPRSAQEYFEAIVARSAVSGAKGIKIFLTLRNFSSDNWIAACHTPPYPLFQHQWAAPHQCQNKFCRWLRLAPLVYLRGGAYRLIWRGSIIHNHFRNLSV